MKVPLFSPICYEILLSYKIKNLFYKNIFDNTPSIYKELITLLLYFSKLLHKRCIKDFEEYIKDLIIPIEPLRTNQLIKNE